MDLTIPRIQAFPHAIQAQQQMGVTLHLDSILKRAVGQRESPTIQMIFLENSSTKQHLRLTSKQQRHHSLAGQHSAAFSTATTSTALDPSGDEKNK